MKRLYKAVECYEIKKDRTSCTYCGFGSNIENELIKEFNAKPICVGKYIRNKYSEDIPGLTSGRIDLDTSDGTSIRYKTGSDFTSKTIKDPNKIICEADVVVNGPSEDKIIKKLESMLFVNPDKNHKITQLDKISE